MKSQVLSLLLSLIVCYSCAQQTTTHEAWLNENVVKLKSIDPTDEDFSDLEFLIPLLENKDIIMLGEEAHSFAHTFKAKSRLVKFLHQQLGFTVLAFEIDGYTLYEANLEEKKPNDTFTPIQKRMYPFWGQATATQELFSYVEKNRSLHLTGFDVQPFGWYLRETLPKFLEERNSEIRNYKNYDRFITLFKKYYRQPITTLTISEYALINMFLDDILYEGKLKDTLQNEEKILYKTLENFKDHLRNRIVDAATEYHMMGNLNPTDSLYDFLGDIRSMGAINRRDEQMALNIQWLKEELYPDKKIVVWAASAHTMYNRHKLTSDYSTDFPFHSRFTYGYNYLNMGTHLKKIYKDQIYSVGFSPVSGTIDHATSKTYNSLMEIEQAPNSIEEKLLDIQGKYLYLDFTESKRNQDIPISLFNTKTSSNILGGTRNYGDISEFFDGILFMKDVTPIKYVD